VNITSLTRCESLDIYIRPICCCCYYLFGCVFNKRIMYHHHHHHQCRFLCIRFITSTYCNKRAIVMFEINAYWLIDSNKRISTLTTYFSIQLYLFYLFIYFEIQHATIQQQNYKVHNTVYAYMDTKGRVSRHLHSTRKKRYKIHTSGWYNAITQYIMMNSGWGCQES